MLLAVQFCSDHAARPLLYHGAPVADAYMPVDIIFHSFLHRPAAVAKRETADNHDFRLGGRAGYLRAILNI